MHLELDGRVALPTSEQMTREKTPLTRTCIEWSTLPRSFEASVKQSSIQEKFERVPISINQAMGYVESHELVVCMSPP